MPGSPSRSRRRPIARRSRDFTASQWEPQLLGDLGVRLVGKVRQPHHLGLLRRQRHQRLADAAFRLGGGQGVVGGGVVIDLFVAVVERFGAAGSAGRVDPQVAGDGEDPGGGAGLGGIEGGGLAPHRQQRLLRQLLGQLRLGAQAQHVALHPRREVSEQRGERPAVRAGGNGADHLGPALGGGDGRAHAPCRTRKRPASRPVLVSDSIHAAFTGAACFWISPGYERPAHARRVIRPPA